MLKYKTFIFIILVFLDFVYNIEIRKHLESDIEYSVHNGHKYITDTKGRIIYVEGDLVLGNADRMENFFNFWKEC